MADIKTLRVCLSSELPDILHRDSDYLYFAYDKLALYCGQDEVSENYAIAEEVPEEQIDGMLYILSSDGSVHRKIDYVDTIVANIEDETQISILKKAGTLYYIDNNRRYFDSQQRTLTLPYTDGTYELAVAMKDNQVFDNNTLIKYNEDTEQFEMYSGSGDDFIDYSKPFRGKETSTVKVNVDGPKISANIKVSKALGNILRATSKTYDKVSIETFEVWKKDVDDFKAYAKDILDKINNEIEHLEELVTEETIEADIYEIVSNRFGDIQEALDNYEDFYNILTDIQTRVMDYAISMYTNEVAKLDSLLEENSNWDELDDTASTYIPEVDYFEKEKSCLYPELTNKEVKTILAAASMAAITSLLDEI